MGAIRGVTNHCNGPYRTCFESTMAGKGVQALYASRPTLLRVGLVLVLITPRLTTFLRVIRSIPGRLSLKEKMGHEFGVSTHKNSRVPRYRGRYSCAPPRAEDLLVGCCWSGLLWVQWYESQLEPSSPALVCSDPVVRATLAQRPSRERKPFVTCMFSVAEAMAARPFDFNQASVMPIIAASCR